MFLQTIRDHNTAARTHLLCLSREELLAAADIPMASEYVSRCDTGGKKTQPQHTHTSFYSELVEPIGSLTFNCYTAPHKMKKKHNLT